MRRRQNFAEDNPCTQVIPVQSGHLNPPSKLKDIEERLRLLGEKFGRLRYLDDTQGNEDVSGLLEDLWASQ